MPAPLTVSFAGGATGLWRIDSIAPVRGDTLPAAPRLAVVEDLKASTPDDSIWKLRGVTSNTRYTKRDEVNALVAIQAPLMRTEATCAALIPIRKTQAWWDLAQDERRAIFEEQSRHIAIGLDYLPGVARRLHHSRELGEHFDFLTWFEYAPEHAAAFENMVRRLRDTAEWRYVDREVDVRLSRD
jgi:chlorite dismutase